MLPSNSRAFFTFQAVLFQFLTIGESLAYHFSQGNIVVVDRVVGDGAGFVQVHLAVGENALVSVAMGRKISVGKGIWAYNQLLQWIFQ